MKRLRGQALTTAQRLGDNLDELLDAIADHEHFDEDTSFFTSG